MGNKIKINERVYSLAHQYNIEQTRTHDIISAYIEYTKVMLINGYKVDIFGLVTIVPDNISAEYTTTLAYECKHIADDLAISFNTVFVIIQEYINSMIDDLLNNRPIEIRGLLNAKPIVEEDKVVKVHTNISSQFKYRLREQSECVTSVRVHTHKLLKYTISVA